MVFFGATDRVFYVQCRTLLVLTSYVQSTRSCRLVTEVVPSGVASVSVSFWLAADGDVCLRWLSRCTAIRGGRILRQQAHGNGDCHPCMFIVETVSRDERVHDKVCNG